MSDIEAVDVIRISEIANTMMADLGIPPTPLNYRVWYTYAAKTDLALRRALDELISNEACFTAERNADIASRFLDQNDRQPSLEAASDQLDQIVTRLVDTIGQAKGDATEFGKRVAHFSHRAGQAETSEQFLAVTRSLLQEVLQAIGRNDSLKKELDEARAEVTKLRTSLTDVNNIAMTDELTGVGNRRAFDRRISKDITEAVERGRPLSIILLDIDRFKQFNDKYGHQVGDQVLRIVAQQLKSSMKPGEFAARYGGEEFVALLPETSLSIALERAERIRSWLAAHDLRSRKTAHNYGKVTASFGVASYRRGETTAEFIGRADAALYRAKRGGRDRVESESKDLPSVSNAIAM